VVAVHEITQRIGQAHDRAAAQATKALRANARSNGWPGSLTGALKVVHDNGAMRVDYPHYLADDIEDLEYGTPHSAPNAVLRTFSHRLDQHADLDTHLDAVLGGLL
jgi:hypothetical protein